MKQSITKKLLMASCIAGAFMASDAMAQHTSHPPFYTGNFYKDYVGTRLQVTQPASSPIARDYAYTTSYVAGGGTASWGGAVTTPLVDMEIVIPNGTPGNDSFGCSGLPVGSMTGKIGVVWRGPITSACEFGAKAAAVQAAGASACIIINEYAGEGPVGMAAGALGAGVTIPVMMIGNLDGIAISALYRSSPAGTVKMSLLPWGKNLANDLGFVPGGAAPWSYSAIPAYQLAAGVSATPYKGIDGAFIANYGTAAVDAPVITSSVTFTSDETHATSTVHTSTMTFDNGATAPANTTFAVADSIYAMFGNEYDLSGTTGKGVFNVKYDITNGTGTDDAPGDNSYTHTFNTTDSTFSKARYDFTNDHPIATLWTSPGGNPTAPKDYMWGVPYYVAKGGAAIKNISFSVSSGAGLITAADITFYVFKWTDGTGAALDNIIDGGELQLMGAATKSFDGLVDSSFDFFTTSSVTTDTTGNGGGQMMQLSDNSWYLVVAQANSGVALGCDGILNMYPRAYGRKHVSNVTELYAPIFPGDAASDGTPAKDQFYSSTDRVFASYFGGGTNAFNIDSTFYNQQIGLIPAISFKVAPFVVNAVNNVAPVASKFEVYPNPAKGDVNVSIELINNAKKVSYTILSSTAQLVATETRNNVQNDKFTYSTNKLAPGNYYVVVNADGKQMFKTFTVIK